MNKVCTKCGENKPLEEYYKDSRTKEGKRQECKSCFIARSKNYNTENKEKILEYHTENKQRFSQHKKKHYIENKQKFSEYYKENKEKILEYRIENKQKILEYQKEYYKSDRGKLTIVRKNNKSRNWKSNVINNLSLLESKCILFLQNYKCIYPDCDRYFDEVKPTLDHIKPLSKGGDLIKENVQYLCRSCNSKKHTKSIDCRSDIHKQYIAKMA